MARGQRKTIDEKIHQQQHMISALESKLKHANEELEALISKKKLKRWKYCMITLKRLI